MANQNYSAEIDALKTDIKSLRDDVSSLVNALGEDIEQRGNAARTAAGEEMKKARERGQHALHEVENSIDRNPLTALATALGIGFLIGALLGRR